MAERELQIIYGGFEVGGVTGREIDGKIQLSRSHPSGSVEFSFVIASESEDDFATEIKDVEDAFRKPYQDLQVLLNGTIWVDARQTENTALNPMPEITKREDDADTGRSRRYTVRVEFGLPADTGGEEVSGLREYAVDVAYDPARRARVTISGVFTAVDTNDARAVYDAAIDDFIDSTMSDLSITNWERTEDPSTRHDTNDKTLEFSVLTEELVFSQAGSSLDDTSIVQQRLSISRRKEGPGDTPSADRLVTLDVSYDAWVDSDSSTDLTGTYSSLRSWLVTQISTTLDGGQLAVIEERPQYFYDENRISVSMVAQGATGGDILEKRVTTEDADTIGKVLVPAWTGDTLSHYPYDGPRTIVRTVNIVLKTLGFLSARSVLGLTQGEVSRAMPFNANGQWALMEQAGRATPLRLGVDDDTLDITEASATYKLQLFKPIGPSSGGGAGPVTPFVPNPGSVDRGPIT